MTVTPQNYGSSKAGSLARFVASGPSRPTLPGGNTPWARRYGDEIKDLIHRQADHDPRSIQSHLGPSEIGVECHRQVVGKMIAVPLTNHVPSRWPPIIGKSVHAWLAQAFEDENVRIGTERFLTELAVAPVPEHPGTTDLYDRFWDAVVDHKVVGPTTLAKIASGRGPSRVYRVQLLLYWLGCLNMGLPAKRIVLIAYPRAAATLDGMYVWEHIPGPEDAGLLAEVLQDTALRRKIAAEILASRLTLEQVPITPGDDCYFCDQFRPASARDLKPGCPGTSIGQGSLLSVSYSSQNKCYTRSQVTIPRKRTRIMTHPNYPDQQQYPPQPSAPQPYAPAAPQQGYYQAPPQAYYPQQGYAQAPPPPQAPAPPRPHRTLADYLEQAGAGTKPLQWDRPGRRYLGQVKWTPGDSDTEEGDPRSDGSVPLTLKIPLKMTPTAEYPDGEATFYCKGHDWNELKRAMSEAGAQPGPPQEGSWIDITYTHDKPVPLGRDGKPRNPRKVKAMAYTPPGAAPQGNGQQAAPVAQEQPPWTPAADTINQVQQPVPQGQPQYPQVQYQQPWNAQQGMQQFAPEMQQPQQGPPAPQVPATGMAGPAQQVAATTQAGTQAAQQAQQLAPPHPYTAALMKQVTGQALTPEDQRALADGPPKQ